MFLFPSANVSENRLVSKGDTPMEAYPLRLALLKSGIFPLGFLVVFEHLSNACVNCVVSLLTFLVLSVEFFLHFRVRQHFLGDLRKVHHVWI